MKVLYLCTDPGIDVTGRSGGSVHIRAVLRAFSQLGHQVSLVASTVSSPVSLGRDGGIEVHAAPVARPYRALGWCIRNAERILGKHRRRNPDVVRLLHNIKFSRVSAATAREFQPDFIYERYSLWGLAGGRLARQLGLPYVLEVNAPLTYEQERRAGLTLPSIARRVERAIWLGAGLVVAVSEELRKDLEAAGVVPERIQVLPNAVDPTLFRKSVDGAALRNKFNLDGRFVIGFVGTFKRWHGVDLLLAAFRELHREDSTTHLLMVGEGPLRGQLEQEVARAGLADAVTFAGSVPHEEVPRYIAAMDVAVAPVPALDRFYYSPLKIFEYMAVGRPVVAGRIGQVARVITEGVNGLLFEPGDVGSLVQQIRRLQHDSTLRVELGKRASAACAMQTWKCNAARLIQWVEPLVVRQPAGMMPPSVVSEAVPRGEVR